MNEEDNTYNDDYESIDYDKHEEYIENGKNF